MTDADRRTIRCCNCATESEHWILLSTNTFGSADLDQRPPKMQRHTMEMWLQECPTCGYVAPSLDKGDETDLTNVSQSEYRALLAGPYASSLERRFLLRAGLFAMRGDAASAFSNTLYAAWEADDRGAPERAREYRLLAAGHVREDASLDIRLRLLDVLRRSSSWEAAANLVEALKSEDLEHPFDAIIGFHVGKIELRDDGRYTIQQAVAG